MKVQELIQELSKLPNDTLVVIDDLDNKVRPVEYLLEGFY